MDRNPRLKVGNDNRVYVDTRITKDGMTADFWDVGLRDDAGRTDDCENFVCGPERVQAAASRNGGNLVT